MHEVGFLTAGSASDSQVKRTWVSRAHSAVLLLAGCVSADVPLLLSSCAHVLIFFFFNLLLVRQSYREKETEIPISHLLFHFEQHPVLGQSESEARNSTRSPMGVPVTKCWSRSVLPARCVAGNWTTNRSSWGLSQAFRYRVWVTRRHLPSYTYLKCIFLGNVIFCV